MDAKALLDVIHDDLALFDAWGVERAFAPIGQVRNERMKMYLRRLHGIFSEFGIKPTDSQRHYIFSRLFDRPIESAKEITVIEVMVWGKIAKTHPQLARTLLTELIHESNGN